MKTKWLGIIKLIFLVHKQIISHLDFARPRVKIKEQKNQLKHPTHFHKNHGCT